MINKIADLALVYGAASGGTVVTADLVEEVLRDGLVLSAPDIPAETGTAPDRPARLVLAHEKDARRDLP